MNSSITSKCIKSHHLYTKLLKHLWTGLPLLFINFGKLNISRAKELVDVEKRKMWGKYLNWKKNATSFGGCWWDPLHNAKKVSDHIQLETVATKTAFQRWAESFSRIWRDADVCPFPAIFTTCDNPYGNESRNGWVSRSWLFICILSS